MTEAQILLRMGVIHGLIEEAQAQIVALTQEMPAIQPFPHLYKCALYLGLFTDGLEIGQKNIDRLTSGRTALPPKKYS